MNGSGTDYLYTDKNGKVNSVRGKYSLEPIPHYLIEHGSELDDPVESIDEFIMLCSPETCEHREGNEKWKDKYLYGNQTPLEHITDKIQGWIEQSIRNNVGGWQNKDINEIKYTKIDINVDDLKGVIDKTVDHLRELKKSGKNVRIIMDCHGGFRGVQLLVEAIITLLGIEGFRVSSKDSWTIYFDNINDLDNTKNIIQRDSEPFEIFNFVAGINEFVNYGRSDSLERFVNEPNDPLLKILKQIADGIQMCLIHEFELGLDLLGDYFNRVDASKTNNSYLRLFEDMIKDNFGNLLSKPRTREEEIKWCLDKGFYQQALTIIEALGPKSLFERSILVYDLGVRHFAAEQDKDVRSEINNEIIKVIFPGEKYKDFIKKKPENGQNVVMWDFADDKENLIAIVKARPQIQKWMEKYREIKDYRNNSNHAGNKKITTQDIIKAIESYLDITQKLEAGDLIISSTDYLQVRFITTKMKELEKFTGEELSKIVQKSCSEYTIVKGIEAFKNDAVHIYLNSKDSNPHKNLKKFCFVEKLKNSDFYGEEKESVYLSGSKNTDAGLKLLNHANNAKSARIVLNVIMEENTDGSNKLFYLPFSFYVLLLLEMYRHTPDFFMPASSNSYGDETMDILEKVFPEMMNQIDRIKGIQTFHSKKTGSKKAKEFLNDKVLLKSIFEKIGARKDKDAAGFLDSLRPEEKKTVYDLVMETCINNYEEVAEVLMDYYKGCSNG